MEHVPGKLDPAASLSRHRLPATARSSRPTAYIHAHASENASDLVGVETAPSEVLKEPLATKLRAFVQLRGTRLQPKKQEVLADLFFASHLQECDHGRDGETVPSYHVVVCSIDSVRGKRINVRSKGSYVR